MLTKKLQELLGKREFISVATCTSDGRPNAAPKFLLKFTNDQIYLVDYTISTTWRNLKVNPRISMSLIDPNTLAGYQINGSVRIIEKGRLYDKMHKEMMDKEIRLTAKHILEDVRGEAKHEGYEVVIREKFVIFEVTIDEVVKIGIKGELERNKQVSKTD